ncbi:CDP-alcohol phosphatidyltransferase family protein [Arthrobacter sp. AL08]|uniref:CDP-alcohol phosphatidyltransferase family protein n=1 Tax=Micrococcaceae TaxID=1268 RepID=UPI001CFFE2D5|nr:MULTISPECIES: CDP-alcohol phosphatidyltransferase family protein [Micrococcaceae]MCB5281607.1 putative CDP-diacylglycerol--glycerol-3-phosphate 3-phosphatidyl-transferase 1 [Arthrobacter sp. ES1]MDI3240670.1 CDP-alcohol phosphatidyltransferase family protein [Arthrobacter sp. AL05]MDI3276680.1 CDP-alcohol phosphatidyltransferase family protein [Arthrobacter sp. AL08]MDJ0352135.1 CDP-alcohol phosphatidyltransferase family protein [Pseudarthrobacter sp. PH31-O2]WGZ80369.1 CDP-alcohol phosphat
MRFIGAGARPGQPQTHHDRVFTIPNVLTVVRFLGVPLFIWLVLGAQEYGFAALVLAVMGSTDWVDGYVARRYDQMSHLGRVMDPIADRLALIAVAVTLVIAGVVQWWYLAALLIPDGVLLTLSLYYFHSHPDLPVSRIGKVRTALLLLGTPLLVLAKLPVPGAGIYLVAAWICLGLGLVGHWIAAYNYFWAIIRKGTAVKDHTPDVDGGTP